MAQEKTLSQVDDLLPLYRYVNAPAHMHALAENNVRPAMRSASEPRYPQIWIGGWEIRNLRMVANIRETFREQPGARVLTIVGASHKPYYEAYLNMMHDVVLADPEAVLR